MTPRILLANVPGPRGAWRRHLLPRYPALTLATLAAPLAARGWSARLLDLEAEPVESLVQAAATDPPLVIGLSAAMPMLAPTLALAATLRRVAPRALLVVGGPLTAAFADRLVGPQGFHVAVRGEGDDALVALVEGAIDAPPPFVRRGVPGTVVADGDGCVVTPEAPPGRELDRLPFPRLDLLPARARFVYHPLGGSFGPGVTLQASRGCPYTCPFCYQTPFKARYRHHSVAYLVDGISRLRRAGVTHVRFVDDVFTLHRDFVLALCDALARHFPGLTWHCGTRVELLDDDVAGAMARAGCRVVNFGLEAAGAGDLDRLRKGGPEAQRLAIEACRRHGVDVIGQFILGFPWDTRRTILDRVRYACTLPLRSATFWPLIPFPGTQLFDEARATHGEFDESFCDHTGLDDPGPLFAPVYSPPGLTRAEISWLALGAQVAIHGWRLVAR